jgi:hypothetical protein
MELPIMDEAWFNSLPAMRATSKVDLDAFFVLQDVNMKLIKRKGKGYPTAVFSDNVYAVAPPSTWENARLAALHLQTHEPPSLPPSTISQWFKAVLDNLVPLTPESTTAEPDMTSPTLTRKQRRKQARKCYKEIILLERKHGIWNSYPFRCAFA